MSVVPFNRDDALAYDTLERVLIGGDLSRLTNEECVKYYMRVCDSVGLNPLTKPFEYLKLNGKVTLYALKGCTDQLRELHEVSVTELTRVMRGDTLIVTATVKTADGRTDMDMGVVALIYPEKTRDRNGNTIPHPKAGQPLTGEDLANAMMKAATKAKRRATLSICGLGMLDETEVEDIPVSAKEKSTAVADIDQVERTIISAPSHEAAKIIEPRAERVPARIQRNLDRLAPKPGGIADRAMVDRAQREWRQPAGPPRPFLASQAGRSFDERNPPPHDGIPDFLDRRAQQSAKALNRQLHPMNDEIPEHAR